MGMLLAAAVVFLAIHFLVSGTRMRDAITGMIGERPYMGLFSLASLATIVWLCWSYNGAQASGDDPLIYDPGHIRDVGVIIVLLAFLLGVPGLMLPNPTSVGGDAGTPAEARGVITITRHPFLWGVTLWSGFHLVANGDEASIILFGCFLCSRCSALYRSMPSANARWVDGGRPSQDRRLMCHSRRPWRGAPVSIGTVSSTGGLLWHLPCLSPYCSATSGYSKCRHFPKALPTMAPLRAGKCHEIDRQQEANRNRGSVRPVAIKWPDWQDHEQCGSKNHDH